MDSAAGILKLARNSETQAILPIRGKILNVEKTDIMVAMKSDSIKLIINTLGCGALSGYNEDDLNYDKIIIATDADVDSYIHVTTRE